MMRSITIVAMQLTSISNKNASLDRLGLNNFSHDFGPQHHIRIHNVGCHGNIDHQLSEAFANGFNSENARLQVGESRLLSNSHATTTEFSSAMDTNLRMRAIPARSLSIENSTGLCDPRHASAQKNTSWVRGSD
jgi:hypothetical protein